MLAMTLGEYRESRDIDFLCSSREGFRSLRETVTDRFQACNDVVGRNIRKLAQDVIRGSPGGHVAEDQCRGDACSLDAGLAVQNLGITLNVVVPVVFHDFGL